MSLIWNTLETRSMPGLITHKMVTCHLPWDGDLAYKRQLWPGLRYGIGAMTNDLEEAGEVPDKTDYKMWNIFGKCKYSGERMMAHSFKMRFILTTKFRY